ncbi:prolyl 4-hydroxylase subunit alpha-2-like [Ornithodoros turicata]|uniref:prolyl 4-hydroxylase subunit alpha-2-like n=1 Tax=Ornithodoros turicata TaxID=34597 RepID=UPI003139E445
MASALTQSFAVLFLCLFTQESRTELFTAIVHLEPLLAADNSIAMIIRRYLDAEYTRLARLESYYAELALLESLHDTGGRTDFMVISRLSWTWLRNTNATTEETKVNADVIKVRDSLPMPTEEDLDGAAVGLCRLLTTYKLTVQQLVDLRTPGVRMPSVTEFLEVAERCFADYDPRNAALWFQQALEAYDKKNELFGFYIDRGDIVKDMAEALFTAGAPHTALQAVNEQLRRTPDDEDLLRMRDKCEKELRKETFCSPSSGDDDSFYKLCLRSERQSSPKFYCKTTTNNGQAWLLLQPLRMEIISVEPRILVFHDFLNPEECRTLRDLARPRLFRAHVYKGVNMSHFSGRIGKVSWFKDCEHQVIRRTLRRITAVTGLSLDSAEQLQILNYGVGGHYVSHYDFKQKGQMEDDRYKRDGNRLATWLIYLSDVTLGGATVFTRSRLTVEPKEGKAVFWYNLVPDPENATDVGRWGEVRTGDMRLEHGACPVLRGSKWIATKWFHERAQARLYYDRPD